MSIITLTTDFGTVDGYAGILKGVIFGIAPHASVVDISHDIKACDIKSGAWVVHNAYKHFPKGTVHVGIVDPGVGSQRRAIVLANEHYKFVGPDNGLFSLVSAQVDEWRVFVLDKPQYWLAHVSSTFHGRDIFAPVAAHLAAGVKPSEVGTEVGLETLVALRPPGVARIANRIVGEVVYVDVFGNLITNIESADIDGAVACLIEGEPVQLGATYSSVPPGTAVAYGGSHGFLEIGVSQGRADEVLRAGRASHVALHFGAKH